MLAAVRTAAASKSAFASMRSFSGSASIRPARWASPVISGLSGGLSGVRSSVHTPRRLFSTVKTAEVILVGCGAPDKGMGWYHAVQMLDGKVPSSNLTSIIEPYFLGAGASSDAGVDFAAWQGEVEADHEVKFLKSLSDLPVVDPKTSPRVALISGRTADNPALLTSSIAAGCNTIYLEKPGAPTVAELQSMKQEAAANNVTVLMGYNKNVCKYVSKVRDFASKNEGLVTFVSNNAYENTKESLGECFERNSEGMLKNMAIHELALLVSFYDVTVENIASVVADKEFSSVQTLAGPSGEERTDFDKIKFTITTKSGKQVSVAADRCGGSDSYATVVNDGKEIFKYSMPDEEDEIMVAEIQGRFPNAMPYFFPQDPDYITVKERVSSFCATGKEAEGVATIDIGVETLRVAEFLTPELQKQLA
ncbi:hypothetical protein TrST_g1022 [Triparma strigata]|uniref:Gfo/Idh/MocA-like oxidoreductase N-terminal domain-containing protein n=2 Tax=Triparma TaxID=722752 RepID=A0A9W7DW21_9STRA|nr:hypothetical protein TrST_g1022 [Triparma strigata]